ncbi:differentially expressed in FDCP 6-like isoform X2 [Lethenteron reissneri]|uniref:differentially expressed in FDCP 6-like isoform X2 n=1 Tax=Lethenteron reissneri TaxID=7753 RepID=UPI002AB73270|nr:differentially expressed in FDCP 6-like isoform X2 [Lethenteron reissneri]
MTDILSLPDLHLEGYLEKQREKLRFHWRRYWFVLRNSSLCYYPSRDSPMPRGRVDVHSVQSVRELNTLNREHVFQVVLSSGKVIILAAASGEQRAVWIQFLWKCMQLPGPGRSVSACAWYVRGSGGS